MSLRPSSSSFSCFLSDLDWCDHAEARPRVAAIGLPRGLKSRKPKELAANSQAYASGIHAAPDNNDPVESIAKHRSITRPSATHCSSWRP
jgi:hypothetical protein